MSNGLLDRWESVVPLLAGVVVVRAECDYARAAVDYVAYSLAFDVVVEGEEIPEYVAEIETHEDGRVDVKWGRCSPPHLDPHLCEHCGATEGVSKWEGWSFEGYLCGECQETANMEE